MRNCFLLFVLCLIAATASASERVPSAVRGYENLRTHQYLPADFDDEVFAALWTAWPEPERSAAEKADPTARRKMTMSYYGLTPVPEDTDGTKPALGYVAGANGTWVMNCLACHGGKVAGRIIPGLPNSHTALQTLTEDVSQIKLLQVKKLSHLDLATLKLPLNMTDGTTNAVVFGIVLGTYRNPDMTVDLNRKLPPLVHHDVDAPPFWNVKKKTSLYSDGHAPKTPRPLMQFILLPRLSPETLTRWEPDFADILAWIESLEAPKYPFEIDQALAARGEPIFREHCSRCHGTYGPAGKYEQKTIAIDEIKTDPVRWKALTPTHRQWLKDGWLSRYGADPVEVDPVGYVAPPLDGIWATAPYFHNGSVPTLWHVLHPDDRPLVWKRTEDGYDQQKIGLEIQTFDKVPSSANHPAQRRRYFNSKLPGKNPAGHTFPNVLDEDEKKAVLEYLKTL